MRTRLWIRVEGIVQGVGFRPRVCALATRRSIGGCVSNDSQGVLIEAEGERDNAFGLRIESGMPQHTTHKDSGILWRHLTVGDRRHHHATIAVAG